MVDFFADFLATRLEVFFPAGFRELVPDCFAVLLAEPVRQVEALLDERVSDLRVSDLRVSVLRVSVLRVLDSPDLASLGFDVRDLELLARELLARESLADLCFGLAGLFLTLAFARFFRFGFWVNRLISFAVSCL